MSDDLGMQAVLALLLRLSDDEIKGVKTAVEAANRAQNIQQQKEYNGATDGLVGSYKTDQECILTSSPTNAGFNESRYLGNNSPLS